MNRQQPTNNVTMEAAVCAICLEPIRAPHTVSCNHTFCRGCIETWSNYHTSCPVCRHHCPELRTMRKDNVRQRECHLIISVVGLAIVMFLACPVHECSSITLGEFFVARVLGANCTIQPVNYTKCSLWTQRILTDVTASWEKCPQMREEREQKKREKTAEQERRWNNQRRVWNAEFILTLERRIAELEKKLEK